MNQSRSSFSSVWFVPPDEDTAVVELSWQEASSSFVIGEVAHDAALNKRLLNYWIPGKSGAMQVPFFEFLERITQANVRLISEIEAPNPGAEQGGDLELRVEAVDSVGIVRRGESMPFARVVLEGDSEALLEIWNPDEGLPLRLPLHDTMTALLEASIRRDKVAHTLRN